MHAGLANTKVSTIDKRYVEFTKRIPVEPFTYLNTIDKITDVLDIVSNLLK